jgi:pyrroline-5-carboxylate reductase
MSSGRPVLLLAGAGKMGSALLEGWLKDSGFTHDIHVREPAPGPRLKDLAREGRISLETGAFSGIRPELVVLAIKPQMMEEVLPGLAPLAAGGSVFLSIAAGTTIDAMTAVLGPETPVIRAMPNTPAAVGMGFTVLTANAFVGERHRDLASRLLGAVGETAWIDDESLMDAVTAVSGSGPAYVFLLAEAMAEAGAELGLDPALAARMARATVAGAGGLLHRDSGPAAELRERVTSPGGTTAAALDVLMGKDGMRPLIMKALRAARDRGRELGRNKD